MRGAWRPCGPPAVRRWPSASTPTVPGRSRRRWRRYVSSSRPVSSCARSPCTGPTGWRGWPPSPTSPWPSTRPRARRGGYEVYLASTLDGPLGIAAALQAAAAIVPDRPCGLATLGLFERAVPGLDVVDGHLAPPAGPGLGAGLRDWYGL